MAFWGHVQELSLGWVVLFSLVFALVAWIASRPAPLPVVSLFGSSPWAYKRANVVLLLGPPA